MKPSSFTLSMLDCTTLRSGLPSGSRKKSRLVNSQLSKPPAVA